MEHIPPDDRNKFLEEACLAFPTWFFEVLTRFDDKPLVLEKFQIKYLLDPSLFKITNKTRQSGGSLQISLAKFYKAYRNPAYRCDIVSINLKEATDKIKYIRNFHETLPSKWQIPLSIDNQLSIGFHKGSKQSVIHSVAASAGVRGGRKDVVFDEFSHIPGGDELFYAAAPAIMRGQLAIDIVSTPLGNRGLFADIFNNVEDEFGSHPYSFFSRHQFLWLDVPSFLKPDMFDKCQASWYNDFKCDMSRMRELVETYASDKLMFFYHSYPWEQFLQEFCGVFLDETTAFFPWALIKTCIRGTLGRATAVADNGTTEYDIIEESLEPWHMKPEGNMNQCFMGVDFGESAKNTDKTSIQVVERLPNGRFLQRYTEILDKAQYPGFGEQAAHIADVYNRMKANRLSFDFTGLGRGIEPLLRKELPNAPIENVNFNLDTKENMVMNFKVLMEQGNLWIQADDTQLQGQIRNIRRDLHPSGRANYHGEPHDDAFWAMALALRGGGYKPFHMYSIGGGRKIVL